MSIKDKKQFGLGYEHIYELLSLNQGKVKFSRKSEGEDKYLTVEKREDEYYFLLEIFQPKNPKPTTKEVTLKAHEFLYVQNILEVMYR